MLEVNVGTLLSKSQGSKENIVIDEPFNLGIEGDFSINGNIQCDLQLLKLPHEINACMKNFNANIETRCSRCLKHFLYKLNIPEAAREFIIDLQPEALELGEDIKYIDRKAGAIILDDMVREEVLLHFPPIPLCSKGCKGLCDKCGINLNEKTCACEHDIDLNS